MTIDRTTRFPETLTRRGSCRRVLTGLVFSVLPFTQASALDITNESTRGFVGTGDDRMIIGFVTEGADTQQYILFGVGPELSESGVTGVLPDPQITLFNSSGQVINSNDNWKDHPSSALVNEVLQQAGLSIDDVEAAMVLTLGAGSWTLMIEGVNGTTGAALGGVAETNVSAPPPPPDTNVGNVCTRELCATSAAAAQQCQEFLDRCLLVEDEDECVGGALLICGTL